MVHQRIAYGAAGVPALEIVRQKKYFHLWHNMEYLQDLHSAIRL